MRGHGALLWAVAAVGVALLVGCTPTTVTKFDAAKNFQKKGNFAAAIQKYNEFIAEKEYPGLIPNAMYNIALSHQGLHKNAEAMAAYKKLIEQYPASEPAKWAEADLRELQKMDMAPASAPAR